MRAALKSAYRYAPQLAQQVSQQKSRWRTALQKLLHWSQPWGPVYCTDDIKRHYNEVTFVEWPFVWWPFVLNIRRMLTFSLLTFCHVLFLKGNYSKKTKGLWFYRTRIYHNVSEDKNGEDQQKQQLNLSFMYADQERGAFGRVYVSPGKGAFDQSSKTGDVRGGGHMPGHRISGVNCLAHLLTVSSSFSSWFITPSWSYQLTSLMLTAFTISHTAFSFLAQYIAFSEILLSTDSDRLGLL